MTTKRVINACAARGIFFDGVREWQNNTVGYGYFIFRPEGGFLTASTLQGLYNDIKKYPKITKNRVGLFYY